MPVVMLILPWKLMRIQPSKTGNVLHPDVPMLMCPAATPPLQSARAYVQCLLQSLGTVGLM